MNITITKIYRSKTKKDGTPLVSKDGRPYERVGIQCREYGAKWLSGFSSPWNSDWKEGDAVEVEVEQSGDFLNFKKTDPLSNLSREVSKLAERVAALEKLGT